MLGFRIFNLGALFFFQGPRTRPNCESAGSTRTVAVWREVMRFSSSAIKCRKVRDCFKTLQGALFQLFCQLESEHPLSLKLHSKPKQSEWLTSPLLNGKKKKSRDTHLFPVLA